MYCFKQRKSLHHKMVLERERVREREPGEDSSLNHMLDCDNIPCTNMPINFLDSAHLGVSAMMSSLLQTRFLNLQEVLKLIRDLHTHSHKFYVIEEVDRCYEAVYENCFLINPIVGVKVNSPCQMEFHLQTNCNH
jgi:hypothetical protein